MLSPRRAHSCSLRPRAPRNRHRYHSEPVPCVQIVQHVTENHGGCLYSLPTNIFNLAYKFVLHIMFCGTIRAFFGFHPALIYYSIGLWNQRPHWYDEALLQEIKEKAEARLRTKPYRRTQRCSETFSLTIPHIELNVYHNIHSRSFLKLLTI